MIVLVIVDSGDDNDAAAILLFVVQLACIIRFHDARASTGQEEGIMVVVAMVTISNETAMVLNKLDDNLTSKQQFLGEESNNRIENVMIVVVVVLVASPNTNGPCCPDGLIMMLMLMVDGRPQRKKMIQDFEFSDGVLILFSKHPTRRAALKRTRTYFTHYVDTSCDLRTANWWCHHLYQC